MEGTVRTFTTEVLDLIERRMREVARCDCDCLRVLVRVRVPPQLPAHSQPRRPRPISRAECWEVVGANNVLEFEPTMGAEDFSYYLLEKPGCYFMIGNGDGAHREGGHGLGPCMLHNASYDFNDDLIPLGATAWVRLAEAWLGRAA
jgi:metal-dependent amidase/aminoacylase/carboxypeptidase family protein